MTLLRGNLEIRRTSADQYKRLLELTVMMRNALIAARTQAASGSIRAMDIETGVLYTLLNTKAELETARNQPGLAAYAKAQQDDPTFDIAAELSAMMGEIDATLAWLEANFPQDTAGHLLSRKFIGDGSGRIDSATIASPGQLAALIVRLDVLLATI